MEGKKLPPAEQLHTKQCLQIVVVSVVILHFFLFYVQQIALPICVTGIGMHFLYFYILVDFPNVVMRWPLLIVLFGKHEIS